MKRSTLAATALLGILTMLSCGGGYDQIPSSSLTVTVSPASATIPRNGTVQLTGSAAGFPKTPTLTWNVLIGTGPSSNCGYLVPKNSPDVASCPYGYVTYTADSGTSGTATYYAPNTAGTYQVLFLAGQFDGFVVQGAKIATVNITVTP